MQTFWTQPSLHWTLCNLAQLPPQAPHFMFFFCSDSSSVVLLIGIYILAAPFLCHFNYWFMFQTISRSVLVRFVVRFGSDNLWVLFDTGWPLLMQVLAPKLYRPTQKQVKKMGPNQILDDSDLENAMQEPNNTNLSTMERKLREKNQQLKKVCFGSIISIDLLAFESFLCSPTGEERPWGILHCHRIGKYGIQKSEGTNGLLEE